MPFTVETELLPGGLANAGVLAHTFSDSDSGLVIHLAEKRIRRSSQHSSEYVFSRALLERTGAGESVEPCPIILACAKTKTHYSILMRYYQGVNRRLDDLESHARAVARSIHRLNTTTLDMPTQNRMRALLAKMQRPKELPAQLDDLKHRVLDHAIKEPPTKWGDRLVKSHNDLYFPNIATEVVNDTVRITHLDFGHIAKNHIGADLHHFLRAKQSGDLSKTFFNALLGEYGKATGASDDLLMYNSYRYALLRGVERSVKFWRQKRFQALGHTMRNTEAMLESFDLCFSTET